MKKVLLSLLVIFTFVGYALFQKFGHDDVEVNVVAPASLTTKTTTQSTPSVAYKDGSYTGNVADAYYGNLQVKVTISGSKISDVEFLQYPNDRPTSVQINTQAMPFLKQEAIKAQSSQVDIVSGATQTSQAFRETLQSALDQAKS